MNVHMIEDIIKCRDDITHFIEKYCGITLSEDQKSFLCRLKSDGKIESFLPEEERTAMMVCFYTHTIVFKVNKCLTISAFNLTQSKSHLDKIRKMVSSLPDHLRPIIEINNQSKLGYDNGNKILVLSMDPKSFRGMGVSMIWVDALYANMEDLKELEICILPCVSVGRDNKYVVTY